MLTKREVLLSVLFGMVHVKDTTTLSLKMEIDELFCKYGISIYRICGQGYDDASNMQHAMRILWSQNFDLNKELIYFLCTLFFLINYNLH